MYNRRQFLSAAGAESALLFLSRTQSAVASPLFREIPPQASGLTWVHNNAASPEKFLPETLGPGCAFLDYDNDGWMDIYLVNSGKSRFFSAAIAAPQRAVQKQP